MFIGKPVEGDQNGGENGANGNGGENGVTGHGEEEGEANGV